MMSKTVSILVVMTLTLSLVSGFMIAQNPSSSSSKFARYAAASDDDDSWKNIMGSEYNIEEYLNEDGWRYRMAQTQDEIKDEGELTFFQRMFGATSNNKVRLAAREDARVNYKVDAEKEALNNEWVLKYGYKRFYTSYLDKSMLDTDAVESVKEAPPATTTTSTPKEKTGSGISLPKISFPSMGGSKAAASTTSATTTAAPKAPSGRPSVVASKKTEEKSILDSTPVTKAKPTPSAKKMTFTVSAVKKSGPGGNLNMMKAPKK